MNQRSEIASFLRSWDYARTMTRSFIEAVPDQHWDFRSTDKHGPLCKQFRHMVWVSDLYTNALRTGKMDMATKKQGYGGSTVRSDLIEAIKDRDAILAALLDDSRYETPDFRIDFFGTPMTFSEFAHVMIQHESLHHGMWSVYAAEAGFDVPKGWKDDWGL